MTLCSSKAETHLAGAWFSFADPPEGAIYRHGGVSVGEIVGVEEVGEMDGEAVGDKVGAGVVGDNVGDIVGDLVAIQLISATLISSIS